VPTVEERMSALFAGSERAHGIYGMPVFSDSKNKWEIKTTAGYVREQATPAHWGRHLTGEAPIGIIPIRADGTCVWGSVDVDEYDGATIEIPGHVEKAKMPLVPCVSKSGGLHLFLFAASPVPADLMQSALRAMAAELGLAGCELFPKQTQILSSRGDLGNWMAMPYCGTTFDGRLREQIGLRPSGGGMTVEEFLRAAEESRRSPEQIREFIGRKGRANGRTNGAGEPFWDGPPCLQHLARVKVPDGGRNNALFMMGIYHKKAHPDDWERRVAEDARIYLDPPAEPAGVESVLQSLRKNKPYEYTCRTEPMRGHCDSARCRTRRFGVGGGGGVPQLSGLSKLEADPAIWFVDVEGSRIEMGTRDLLNYSLFQQACAEHLTMLPLNIKQSDWIQIVSAAMTNAVRIEPAEDVRRGSDLTEMIEEFLVNRKAGDNRDDLLNGRAYHNEEEQRHEFVLTDLLRFLHREGRRDATRAKVARHVESMGGGRGFYNIRGRGQNYRWVPDSALRLMPRAETPRIREEDA
jgi:hypothetical protein